MPTRLKFGRNLYFNSILLLAGPSNNYVGLILSMLFLLLLCIPHLNVLSTFFEVVDGIVSAECC